jgi:hypothetical protein
MWGYLVLYFFSLAQYFGPDEWGSVAFFKMDFNYFLPADGEMEGAQQLMRICKRHGW